MCDSHFNTNNQKGLNTSGVRNVFSVCVCICAAYAVSRISCPPSGYCGVITQPDATPEDNFPSVKCLSICCSHPPTHAQPHASLNTMGTCPTPPCHLAKNNSFSGLRREDCIITIVCQDFHQPKQHGAVIPRYDTSGCFGWGGFSSDSENVFNYTVIFYCTAGKGLYSSLSKCSLSCGNQLFLHVYRPLNNSLNTLNHLSVCVYSAKGMQHKIWLIYLSQKT